MRPHEWRRLFRSDLKTFDDRSTELILAAMDRGAMGRISSKGHAILRGPEGQTMSVSRNSGSGNRGRQNMEADFVRIFGSVEMRALPRAVGDDEPFVSTAFGKAAVEAGEHPLVPATDHPMLECPAEWCDAEFVTGGARYTHVQRDHFPCQEPGCDRVFKEKRAAQGHYNLKHGDRGVLHKCPEPGCEYEGTGGGLGGHTRQVHLKGRPAKGRKSQAKPKAPRKVPQQRSSSDSANAVQAKAVPAKTATEADVEALLARMAKDLIAMVPDPRVAELEARVAELEAHNGELEARLALLKEALNA